MELSFGYGRGEMTLKIAQNRLVDHVLLPSCEALSDVPAAVRQAMANPVGPSLDEVVRPGERVLLLTVDMTRPNPTPLLVPLMEQLDTMGVHTEVMIALGLHHPMSDAELDAFIGFHDVLQPDACGEHVCLGVTDFGTPIEVDPRVMEFDKRIIVGFTEPTYIAGYSGGRKLILPGVSSNRAISHNHFMLVHRGRKLGVLEGNPIHEDMMQAARAVGVHWLVDAVVNPDDTLGAIHTGDVFAAHRQAARQSAAIYEYRVAQKADIVITSAGGYPYDIDMVQAKKALVPAMECVREGGVVILLGECEKGWGVCPPHFPLLDREAAPKEAARIREMVARDACDVSWAPCSAGFMFYSVVHEHGARLIIVSRIRDEWEGTFVEWAPDLATAMTMAEATVGANASVSAIPGGRRAVCVYDPGAVQ